MTLSKNGKIIGAVALVIVAIGAIAYSSNATTTSKEFANFEGVDKNGDGVLDRAEFASFLKTNAAQACAKSGKSGGCSGGGCEGKAGGCSGGGCEGKAGGCEGHGAGGCSGGGCEGKAGGCEGHGAGGCSGGGCGGHGGAAAGAPVPDAPVVEAPAPETPATETPATETTPAE